jgi:Ni,Fe-hydrogenase I cytochrome b subunit
LEWIVNEEDVGKRKLIPRPPPVVNPTDFIVIMFAVLVVTVFFIITLTGIFLALFTDKNVSGLFTVLSDTMTSITAAIAGYMAGRGVNRMDKP